MSAELIFSICNLAVIPAWLLLAFLPRWKWTLGLITTVLVPGMLALTYLFLLIYSLSNMPEGGGFGSLAGVSILFADPYSLLAGWIHYLAFDLFIGAWEVRDSQKNEIPHWLVLPCLFLTFMAGPMGLLLYLVIRLARTRQILVYG
ncbi:MAG: ABA4-like family protein [Gammaproteobacteria bacterium]